MILVRKCAVIIFIVCFVYSDCMEERKRKPQEEFCPVKKGKIFNSKSTSELFRAIADGDEDLVSKLVLEENADVNGRDDENVTPLHRALELGSKALVNRLMNLGADASLADQQARNEVCFDLNPQPWQYLPSGALTPLEYTILMLDDPLRIEILTLMIESGAVLNPRNEPFTPLHIAATTSSAHSCLKMLLLHKANPNQRNSKSISPLFVSAFYGNAEGVLTLLEYGADANMQQLFMGSQRVALSQPVRALSGVLDEEACPESLASLLQLLHLLLRCTRLSLLDLQSSRLLDRELPLLHEGYHLFNNAIEEALVLNDQEKFMGELLQLTNLGRDLTEEERKSLETTAFFALGRGNKEFVAFIIDNFGSVLNPRLCRELFIGAARFGHTDILSYLHNSIEPTPELVNEAFVVAGRARQPNSMIFLYSTDMLENSTIEIVLNRAIAWGQTTVFKMLLNYILREAKVPGLFIQAAAQGRIKLLRLLSDGSVIPSAQLEEAILKAALGKHVKAVRYILLLYPDIDVTRVIQEINALLEGGEITRQSRTYYEEILNLLKSNVSHTFLRTDFSTIETFFPVVFGQKSPFA